MFQLQNSRHSCCVNSQIDKYTVCLRAHIVLLHIQFTGGVVRRTFFLFFLGLLKMVLGLGGENNHIGSFSQKPGVNLI